MSKIIEKAKKLKALADRGVGGEKDNAKRMLKDFCKKHKIDIDNIDGRASGKVKPDVTQDRTRYCAEELQGLKIGMFVRHERFGTGQVFHIEYQQLSDFNCPCKATIRFNDSNSIKQFLLRFAKLEIISEAEYKKDKVRVKEENIEQLISVIKSMEDITIYNLVTIYLLIPKLTYFNCTDYQ